MCVRPAITKASSSSGGNLSAKLTSNDYRAHPHETVTFNASPSSVHHDTIHNYQWDFNGDGTIDQITTTPQVSYSYLNEFTGTMTVAIASVSGLIDTTSASVRIQTSFDTSIPVAPTNLNVKALSDTTAVLSWNKSDSAGWAVSINGIHIGRLPTGRTSINISDLDRSRAIEFGVQAFADNGDLGDMARVTLRPDETAASMQTTTPDQPLSYQDSNTSLLSVGASPQQTSSQDNATPITVLATLKTQFPWVIVAAVGITIIVIGSIVVIRRVKSSE